MPRKKRVRKIAVIDFETDPFLYGRIPEPFAAGFFDGENYVEFWGPDCAERLADFLEESDDEYLIYAHNGGKFDFYFLLYAGAIQSPLKIINGRIVKAKMGRHEIRDSYAILPIPLKAYQKDEIDYKNFEAGRREKFKADILHYLAKDCEYLHKLVTAFIARFGIKLTIGGTAIKELEHFHPFEKTTEYYDEVFRPFYFGGRVECFEAGLIPGKFQVYDVNSMYPDRMRNCQHPTGSAYCTFSDGANLTKAGYLRGFSKDAVYFIHFTGRNKGALPTRTKDGLTFNLEYGEFWACSHELQAALKLKLVKIDHVHQILVHLETESFDEFVDTHIVAKIEAKRSGDKAAEIFAKLLLNSSYGKFAQDGRKFKDYRICEAGEITLDDLAEGWELLTDYGKFEIWEKPNPSDRFLNVATAASITSASRALLLTAIHAAKRPIYCDTDSLVCEKLDGVKIDEAELGAWKFEGECDLAAIAGKKLYALFKDGECFKVASKGVRLQGEEIVEICKGKEIICRNDAPNFKLSGDVKFVERKIKKNI